MAITENLDSFLADFGVVATYGSESAKVIFDTPDQIIAGEVISAQYAITYKTGVFATIKYNDSIVVNGTTYTAGSKQLLDDGAFTKLDLNA
jgi:hypothetical protein